MRHLILIALVAAACKPSDEEPGDFVGGDFSFQTVAVDDACFDGGFEPIFMPDGQPNDFGDNIYVPGADELGGTFDVPLSDPFQDINATITGTDTTRVITGADNTDVELDAEDYPGCLVNMSIDVSLTIVDNDNVQGTATLSTSSFDEEGCPDVSADPCTITLDIVGTRVTGS
jgi:hypothetical protein